MRIVCLYFFGSTRLICCLIVRQLLELIQLSNFRLLIKILFTFICKVMVVIYNLIPLHREEGGTAGAWAVRSEEEKKGERVKRISSRNLTNPLATNHGEGPLSYYCTCLLIVGQQEISIFQLAIFCQSRKRGFCTM